MEKPLGKQNVLALFLIGFAGNVAWAVENQYYNVFLFNEIIPDTFYVSLMVAITAVVSTVTSLVMGAVSDIKGKRQQFILISFIFWAIFTALFPFSSIVNSIILGIFLAILLDSIMTFFGATAYDACYNAFIIDITTLKNRGKAESINQITTLFATLVVYGSSGFIIENWGYFWFFGIIGFITGILGLLGTYFMKDIPDLQPKNVKIMEQLKSTFRPQLLKENIECMKVLIGIAVWSTGFMIFFPFVVIYLEHSINFDPIQASLVMFLALFISVILSIPIGMYVDKIGRKKVAIGSVIFESIALTLFAFTNQFIWVTIMGIFWVFFMTTFQIASYTWVKDMYPRDKAGQFTGYFLIAKVLVPMIIGSPLGGWFGRKYGDVVIVDGMEGIAPASSIFILAAIISIFALFPLWRANDKKK